MFAYMLYFLMNKLTNFLWHLNVNKQGFINKNLPKMKENDQGPGGGGEEEETHDQSSAENTLEILLLCLLSQRLPKDILD